MTSFQPQIPSNISPSSSAFRQPIPDDNTELGHELTRLAGHINAANYRFLKLLAALVERKAWAEPGFRSPAHWLNYYCGISLGPAREKVRVALALAKLPMVDGAFSRGEISYSMVRAMTRAATPENESFLLRIAQHGTASHMEKLVRQYERAERLSKNDHCKTQSHAREFSWYTDDDGMLVFRGRLAPEDGAVFVKAMDAVMHQVNEEKFQQKRAEETDQNLSKDVSAETFSQKRADALSRMAEHYLATGEDGPAPINSGDKYQVVVHINTNPDSLTPPAHIENGPVLSPATVKRLASDSSLITVLEDDKGNVLDVGRKTRTIPPAIRRTLIQRDKGCRFPGCCESKYVDAHHIHHWCDGGETKMDNLVLLCRKHHRLIHEENYQIKMDETGIPRFTNPNKQAMPRARYPLFAPENVDPVTALAIERQHEEQGIAIDEHTAKTAWLGETMDYGLAVESLFRMSGNSTSLP